MEWKLKSCTAFSATLGFPLPPEPLTVEKTKQRELLSICNKITMIRVSRTITVKWSYENLAFLVLLDQSSILFPPTKRKCYPLEPIACFPPSSSLPCALKTIQRNISSQATLHLLLFQPLYRGCQIFLHGRSMVAMMDLQKYIRKFFLMNFLMK